MTVSFAVMKRTSPQIHNNGFNIQRLSPQLQAKLGPLYTASAASASHYLAVNQIHQGDARTLIPQIEPNSVALSVWSPPYFVGKNYEPDLTFDDWKHLLSTVIQPVD